MFKKILTVFIFSSVFLIGCKLGQAPGGHLDSWKEGEVIVNFPLVNFGEDLKFEVNDSLEVDAICTGDINYLEILLEGLENGQKNSLGTSVEGNCNFTLLPEMWAGYGSRVKVTLRGLYESEKTAERLEVFNNFFVLNFGEAGAAEIAISDEAEAALEELPGADSGADAMETIKKMEEEVLNKDTPNLSKTVKTGESSVEFEFCGELKEFFNYVWYYPFLDKLVATNRYFPEESNSSLKLKMGDVGTICHSTNAGLAVVLIPGRYDGKGFQILKFNTKEKTLESAKRDDLHGGKDSAWYKLAKERAKASGDPETKEVYPWEIMPERFGKRVGNIIYFHSREGHRKCNGHANFVYDFEKNYVELVDECSVSYR